MLRNFLFRLVLTAVISALILSSCSVARTTSINSQRLHSVQELFIPKVVETVNRNLIMVKGEVLTPEKRNSANNNGLLAEIGLNAISYQRKIIKKYQSNLLNNAPDECDEIVLYGGERIKAKIVEITDAEIKYKKCDNQNGPTFTALKSDVKEIKHSDGSIETITAPSKTDSSTIAPRKDVNYLGLSLLMFLCSLIMTIIAVAVAVALSSVIVGVIFYFIAAMFGIAFAVYFYDWLQKMVS